MPFFQAFRSAARVVDDYLMGYDVFISYSWKDGRSYAEQLAEDLRKNRYRCFLDSSEYHVGDDLGRDARRAVRCSRALAVVVTPEAIASKHVRNEISLFDSKGGPLVPIDMRSTLYSRVDLDGGVTAYKTSAVIPEILEKSGSGDQASIRKVVDLLSRDRRIQIEERSGSRPSASTVEGLCKRFDFSRRLGRRLRAIGASCVLLVGLAAVSIYGMIESDRQRERAEDSLADALKVANVITEEVDVKLADVAGAEDIRNVILGAAYPMLEGLLSRTPENREINRSRARLARNHGGWEFRHNNLNQAQSRYETSRAILAGLVADPFPDTAEELMNVKLNLGRVNRDLKRLDEAGRFYQDVLSSVAVAGDDRVNKMLKARALYGMGDLEIDRSAFVEAGQYHGEAARLRRERVAAVSENGKPPDAESLEELAASLDRLGYIASQKGNHEEAGKLHEEIHRLMDGLASAHPGNAQYRRDLALAAARLGNACMDKGDLGSAGRYFSEGAITLESLVSAAPSSKTYRYDWAIALSDCGDLATRLNEFGRAAGHYQKSIEELEKVIPQDPENATMIGQKAVTLGSLGGMYLAAGDKDRAMEKYRESLAVTEELIRRWPETPGHRIARSLLYLGMAGILKDTRPEEARSYLAQAEKQLEQLSSTHPGDTRIPGILEEVRRLKGSF